MSSSVISTIRANRLAVLLLSASLPCYPVLFPFHVIQHSVAVLALPYRWRQQLNEVDVTIEVPQGTRGRDLVVVVKKNYLSVSLKGKEPIMAGDLPKEIKVEESTWTIGMLPTHFPSSEVSID